MESAHGQDDHRTINRISSRTGAEQRLARALRAKKLKFIQNQHVESYEVDFFFPEYRLVVEVDGYTHLSTVQNGRDSVKDRKLVEAGYLVIRLTNQAIWDDLQGSVRMLTTLLSRMKTARVQGSINDQWKSVLKQVRSDLLRSDISKTHSLSSCDVEAFFLSLDKDSH